ncbi:agenet domain-containing protein [Azospirillum agricola]|uniref:agenet domain-containing protein n=1 Tax=Azospirillum agricola TaxID=1720247 RepID=UPI000A0F2E60|nr:agenet domain-containing protein [Azospirillum agricola]SMH62108.1 Agenet domain-containing protein [Azospirillum lipoferum]
MTGFGGGRRAAGRQVRRRAGLALAAFVLFTPASLPAVVVLDSTWREEGGARGREADGFGAHVRLAGEPQFRSLMTLSYDGGETWGDGSATWIGNDESHGYALTSAHNFDEATARDVLFRTDGGAVIRADRVWLHPRYDPDPDGDRTGVDAAIVRLVRPVRDSGPAPLLYAGRAEQGRTITFVGFGTRGIGSVGEDERYNRGSGKAAAQGVVEEAVALRRSSAAEDAGNYLTVFLPREDGRIENPFGGARRPASRLAGLLGAGDSGGSAWMPLGDAPDDGWAVVGINTSGDGKAQYGDSSWFVRVSGLRSWVSSVFPGARFAAEPESASRSREPEPAVAACEPRARVFAFSDGAWYPARVLGPDGRSKGGADGCRVRFDGYSSDMDEIAGRDRLIPWTADGPGAELDGCRPGAAVVAEEDEVWYPATIRKAGGKACVVRYRDGDYDDEALPLARLRLLR